MRALHRMSTNTALLALAFVALAATAAMAHKVNVYAVVENGTIIGEGYFGGGAKAQNVPVELRDVSGALLATATTDTGGAFSIPLPKGAAAPLTIILKAGEGHQNDFTLTAQDLAADGSPVGQSSSGRENTSAPPAVHGLSSQTSASPPQAAVTQALSGMAPDALAALVEAATAKAVEQKIAPLRMDLAKLASEDQSGRLHDIVGGLGWIVGLVGITAWFKRPKA